MVEIACLLQMAAFLSIFLAFFARCQVEEGTCKKTSQEARKGDEK